MELGWRQVAKDDVGQTGGVCCSSYGKWAVASWRDLSRRVA